MSFAAFSLEEISRGKFLEACCLQTVARFVLIRYGYESLEKGVSQVTSWVTEERDLKKFEIRILYNKR